LGVNHAVLSEFLVVKENYEHMQLLRY
jgi:hypothetical protein